MSTGSLGQGISAAVGMALAGKMDKKSYRVYAALGDGEIEEGQTWEAAMAAAKFGLDNLCAVLDVNGLQIDGATKDVMRSVRADAYILPNEGKRKVYIFPDCGKLDARGQDIMLKTVEEGPERAAFIFCAENASSLLATMRSRCIELRLTDDGADDKEKAMCGRRRRRRSGRISFRRSQA